MDAYMRNKKTNAIIKINAGMADDYLNTKEWVTASVIEYKEQQGMAKELTKKAKPKDVDVK